MMREHGFFLHRKRRRETAFWAVVVLACVLTAVVAYVTKSWFDEASNPSPMMFSPYEERTSRTIRELKEQMIHTEESERGIRTDKRREEDRLRRQGE